MKVKNISQTTRVRMYDHLQHFVVAAQQYFPTALDAGPDGWRDTIWTIVSDEARADEVFNEFIQTEIRYRQMKGEKIICQ